MNLVILRSAVISTYNIRKQAIDSTDKLYSTIENFYHSDNLGKDFKYIKSLDKLIGDSFQALTDQNYPKAYKLHSRYNKLLDSIKSDLNKISSMKLDVMKYESEISTDSGSIWSKIRSNSNSTESKFSALKSRVDNYHNQGMTSNSLEYRLNYLMVLSNDLNFYYKKWIKDKFESGELIIQPSAATPQIQFSTKHNSFIVKGRAYPTYPDAFWDPIIEWLNFHTKSGNIKKDSLFEINLEYMNTRTMNYIFKILKIVEDNSCRIHWYYEGDDEDMLDTINTFKGQVSCPITTINM